jgi:hypothetical protein
MRTLAAPARVAGAARPAGGPGLAGTAGRGGRAPFGKRTSLSTGFLGLRALKDWRFYTGKARQGQPAGAGWRHTGIGLFCPDRNGWRIATTDGSGASQGSQELQDWQM